MSVTSFKEIHTGRDGDESLGSDGRQIRRYSRVFRVTTGSNYDGAYVILNSLSCPRIGQQYLSDIEAFCRQVMPRNESFSKRVWIVTALYSTEKEVNENPLQDAAEIEWSTEQFQRIYQKDRNNAAILNAASDYFDPPVEGDDSRWVVTVRKNVASVPNWILYYRDAVNSDHFTVDGIAVEPNEAKMQAVSIGLDQERNGVVYRVLTMRIMLKYDERQHGVSEANAVEKGWTLQILNQGLYQSLGGLKIPCRDDNRADAVDPKCLAANGTQLAFASLPAGVTYINADIYPLQAFASLPLS